MEKGLVYEKYVKDFILQQLGKNAYLWNECPENILIDNGLIDSHNGMRLLRKDIKEDTLHNHKDIGIDIIQLEDDEKCSIVQCKNGYNKGLGVEDIAGIMMRSAFSRELNTFIYYTYCLSRNIRYTANISPYVRITEPDKIQEVNDNNKIYFVKLPYEKNEANHALIKKKIEPYSYQIEALAKFKEHFIRNNRGILSLPCGCGKTYTSYLISNEYKHVIILSPLREFARQNLNRFIEYGYEEGNTLLVDTDGNRDIDSIKQFIANHNKLLISTTYYSMDVISKCLDSFNDTLFIVDEFHNLSKVNISDNENDIFKILMSEHRILFMSATPRIYDIEYDADETFDMEWLFGDLVYQMSFTDAITNKYITDYKIWLPSVHENNEELDKELSIYTIENEIKNRCKFLYSCIANNGSRKSIVYCKDTEDMKAMMECMKTLNNFYIMDIDMYSISCEDTEKNRKHILQCFARNNDNIQLLFNIRILNECIDIPSCDSIYISYAPKNKITTIQRISRATRIDKNNPYKVANIYMWCEAYEEILETLSSIKEFDIMFKDKIKVNSVDFYHNKEDKLIELVENDKILISNCIIGVKEFRQYNWDEKLQMVEEYIIEHGKLPISRSENKATKYLGNWIQSQKRNMNKDRIINATTRLKWEHFIFKYEKLFKKSEEIWLSTFQELNKYVEEYNKLPAKDSKNQITKKLGIWVFHQKQNYKNNQKIMHNASITKIWEEFMCKYLHLFRTNEQIWIDTLNHVIKYINEYNKLPSAKDQDKQIRQLGCWVSTQKTTYDDNECIMKNEYIKRQWEEFMRKYPCLFKNNFDIWRDTLEELIKYIDIYHKLPSKNDKNLINKQLGEWAIRQKRNFKKGWHIMKSDIIKKEWDDFTSKYPEIFKKRYKGSD